MVVQAKSKTTTDNVLGYGESLLRFCLFADDEFAFLFLIVPDGPVGTTEVETRSFITLLGCTDV